LKLSSEKTEKSEKEEKGEKVFPPSSSSIYSGSFRPFTNQGLYFSNPLPYNMSAAASFPFTSGVSLGAMNNLNTGQINMNKGMNLNVSNFKIDNIPEDYLNVSRKNSKVANGGERRTGRRGKYKKRVVSERKDEIIDNNLILKSEASASRRKLNSKGKVSKKLKPAISTHANATASGVKFKNIKNSKNSKMSKLSKIGKMTKGQKLNMTPPPTLRSKKYSLHTRNSNFGLKEISKKVKEIVKKLRRATYKQISDVIVNEINEKDSKDEKNIRRRIYDSLNVMKAMNLFRKDTCNKFILWNGDAYLRSSRSQSFQSFSGKCESEPSKDIRGFSFSKQTKTKSFNGEIKSAEKENLSELKNLIVN
jgi:hypothetical protein